MKRLILILILAATSTASASTEYLRPTADATSSSSALKSATCAGTATNQSSSSNSAVYTGKSGIGPTGSADGQSATTDSTTGFYKMRGFTTWQSTTNTYTALTVSISIKCATVNNDAVQARCGAAYSTNGGSAWTNLYTYASTSTGNDTQTTYTVTITGTALSSVQIGVCALVNADSLGDGLTSTVTIYDIWTAGTYTGSTSHARPWLLSELDEKIWRMEYPWRREWV